MAARAFRGLHGLIAVVFLLAIVYVWWCALTGRRDRWLRAAVAALVTEGVFVTANRGDSPLGGVQDPWRPGAIVRARALAVRGPPRGARPWGRHGCGHWLALARATLREVIRARQSRQGQAAVRPEERRVGKECRSRCDWSSDVCSSDLPSLGPSRLRALACSCARHAP